MVFGLAAVFQDSQVPVGIEGCRCKNFQQVGGAHVVGTGAGHEDAARSKHLQGAQVEFLVAADGGFTVLAGLGESRRVENDGVVFSARVGVVAEEVEGI